MIQQDRVQEAVRTILSAIGEDPNRKGLLGTPERVASMCAELFSGVGLDPAEAIDTLFESADEGLENEEESGVVVLRDVPFFSTCEHHLLPFFGRAHMGYIPNGTIAGVSKLARALDVVTRRPQVQERMTAQLADAMFRALNPDGVAVVVEAEHLCMVMRGVKKQGSLVVTATTRGPFSTSVTSPGDFLAFLQRR